MGDEAPGTIKRPEPGRAEKADRQRGQSIKLGPALAFVAVWLGGLIGTAKYYSP